METLKIKIDKVFDFVKKESVYAFSDEIKKHNKALHDKSGKGNDFLGWVNLPSSISEGDIKEIQSVADTLREKCEVVIVIGIGGSYLGAKAVIEALSDSFLLATQM